MRAKELICKANRSDLADENAQLRKALAQSEALRKAKAPKAGKPKGEARPFASFVRLVIPDSHGAHIDWPAARAMLKDAKELDPKQVVLLGDHLDCGGTFNSHQRTYTNELAESYADDVAQANVFLSELCAVTPNARGYDYIEGNHEQHVERWAARSFTTRRDADLFVESMGPQSVLHMKERGIRYRKRSEFYDDLSIPGAIRLGKIIFVHGISHGKHATYTHLVRVGTNVVHGHTHRAQSAVERTVMSAGFGAWCPGTLAKLQPLYKHTEPSSWSHGFAVEFVQKASGRFLHLNVTIHDGESQLLPLLKLIR